jgi:hypothetical protein
MFLHLSVFISYGKSFFSRILANFSKFDRSLYFYFENASDRRNPGQEQESPANLIFKQINATNSDLNSYLTKIDIKADLIIQNSENFTIAKRCTNTENIEKYPPPPPTGEYRPTSCERNVWKGGKEERVKFSK